MELGLNLSFATKRFLDPYQLASMCKHEFAVDHIQFTWDLVDPWWPKEYRDPILVDYKQAFDQEGLTLDSSFGGLASYTYAHLLAPAQEQRKAAMEFFKRSIDLTKKLGAKVMGTPVGGMSYGDAKDPEIRKRRYQDMISQLKELAAYGLEKGIEEIHIEATPLITEFPHSPEVSAQMMGDLTDSAIEMKLLIDWGHALYQPLLKDEANLELWIETCEKYIGSMHLQQTDGRLDRHWDFTKEGIVTPELMKWAIHHEKLKGIVNYLEVVTIFEVTDDEVYEGMKRTFEYLHKIFD